MNYPAFRILDLWQKIRHSLGLPLSVKQEEEYENLFKELQIPRLQWQNPHTPFLNRYRLDSEYREYCKKELKRFFAEPGYQGSRLYRQGQIDLALEIAKRTGFGKGRLKQAANDFYQEAMAIMEKQDR